MGVSIALKDNYFENLSKHIFPMISDPCGEGTKHMIEDSWIPDPDFPCKRCSCMEVSEGKGVVVCVEDEVCANEEAGESFIANQKKQIINKLKK